MKVCVYTYLIGSYDRLLDQPVAADSDADFICFTDDATLTSDTWEIRVIEPLFYTDLVRSARALKIIGHPSLDEYDITLCIDASVLLRQTPEHIIQDWLPDDADIALAQHSYREQVVDEFDEVVRLNYDDRVRVHEQLMAYSIAAPDALTQKPLWTGMMVRRRTPLVAETMRLWFDHVLRFSRRDQLSINVVLARTGVRVRRIPLDNFRSDAHQWPAIEGRRIAQGKTSPFRSGPLLAELRRAQRRVDALDAQLQALGISGIDDLTGELEQLRGAADRARHAEQHVAELTGEATQWRERWVGTQGVTGASANLVRAFVGVFRRR